MNKSFAKKTRPSPRFMMSEEGDMRRGIAEQTASPQRKLLVEPTTYGSRHRSSTPFEVAETLE